MKILVLNSGSSSQKACLYRIGSMLPRHPVTSLWEGRIEWHNGTAIRSIKNSKGFARENQVRISTCGQMVRDLLTTAWEGEGRAIASCSEIDAVGHRFVHGGPHFEEPVVITPEVRQAIAGAAEFAPLHIRAELEGVDTVKGLIGAIPQAAVFDAGFHRRIPAAASVYPGPYEWLERGIRRYGFHGINHQYCTDRAAQILGREKAGLRLVICHLGNGCSLAAVRGGRSVDTTMGFTPLDGLMMGTRSGAVDPGILTYLMRDGQVRASELDELLNEKSGLLGISGLSSDMRDILTGIQQGHERAELAFNIYVHRLRSAIGSMIAVLGGVDALVFTGGVGENSPDIRQAACRTFGFLGLRLDREANARPIFDADISSVDSRVRVLVIRAEEDWAIATEVWKLTNARADVTADERVGLRT
ncbi:MAG: acetate kinase [Acidobacteriia bacterium]|nr:acetate kinase [Terriglobia bacterium]